MKKIARYFVVLLSRIVPFMLISCNSTVSMKKSIELQFIERAGDSESTIKLIQMYVRALTSQRWQVKSIKYGNISYIIKAGKKLHSIVLQIIEMFRQVGTDIIDPSVLAISDYKRKNLKFLDISGVEIRTLKPIFPDFNNKIHITEKKSRTFILNNILNNSK